MLANMLVVLQQLVFGASWMQLPSMWGVLMTVVPAWLLGLTTGYLIPRPDASGKDGGRGPAPAPSPWFLFLSGPGLRRFAVLYHLGLIVREVWVTYTAPGTFRAFTVAIWRCCCGKGFDFVPPPVTSLAYLRAQYHSTAATNSSLSSMTKSPSAVSLSTANATAADSTLAQVPEGSVLGNGSADSDDGRGWYITQDDLGFFKYTAEQDGEVPGAGAWEQMMDKDIPNQIKYTSFRRTLPNGKTEYKSITYSPDATAQEFSDLYFDDDFRPTWDTMIVHREVLENGCFDSRQQVVRWIRRFPFKFLSDREYCIARRRFVEGDSVYGLTRAVPDHPVAHRVRDGSTTQMDVFYSMWRSRTVPCPWGSGKPAVETLLLHHEQFKIPENLARFAVRHGMWGFVKGLSEKVPGFVQARRARGVDPFKADPHAFGYQAGMGSSTPQPSQSPYPASSSSSSSGGALGLSPVCLSRAASGLVSFPQQQQYHHAQQQAEYAAAGATPFHLSGSCLSLASMDSYAGGNNGGAGSGRGYALDRHMTVDTSMLRISNSMAHMGLLGHTHSMHQLMPCPATPSPASACNQYYYAAGAQPADKAGSGSGNGGGGLNKKVRRVLAMALAGSMAVAFKRSSSMPNLPGDHSGSGAGQSGGSGSGMKATKQRHLQHRRQQALGPC